MRTRGYLYALLAAAALLVACDGPKPLTTASQELASTGRRVIGNGDLLQPRFTNGGPNPVLTVTGLNAQGFETVFVLNAITIDYEVVSRADTVLDQATGFPIEFRPDDDSFGGTPSQEGAFAAYVSMATNLLEARRTTFERRHVYLRDVFGEANELISVGVAPHPGNATRVLIPDEQSVTSVPRATNPEANDDTTWAVMSGDGRFIVFATRATNIVPLAKNGLSQIYVYDDDFRSIELITRVAIGADVFPGDGDSVTPHIATTGHFVVYQSKATNLIEGEPQDKRNMGIDIFVFNRSSRVTDRLKIDPGDPTTTDTYFEPGPPLISKDGNIVVFSAKEADTPTAVRHIYAHDRSKGETTRLSEDEDGVAGDANSSAPGLDENGRFVVFQSDATNLVPIADANGNTTDIFVFDLSSLTIPNGHSLQRVNVNKNGVQADGESIMPTISADGMLIAFVSRALNLVAPSMGEPFPPNRTLDLYVFDNPLLP